MIAGLLGDRPEDRPHHRVGDACGMAAVDHQIGHFEHAEFRRHRGHHRGRQRQIDGTELELFQQLAVAAELARAIDHDLGLVAELSVGARGEQIGGLREQRAGRADMAEFDLGLRRGGCRRQHGGRGECEQGFGKLHGHPPWYFSTAPEFRARRYCFEHQCKPAPIRQAGG